MTRSELDAPDMSPSAGSPQIWAASDPQNPHGRGVALEEGIDGLRGRVPHELDRPQALSFDDLGQLGEGLGNAFGSSGCGRVRRWHHGAGDDLVRDGIASHGLGEGSADIDADPQTHA